MPSQHAGPFAFIFHPCSIQLASQSNGIVLIECLPRGINDEPWWCRTDVEEGTGSLDQRTSRDWDSARSIRYCIRTTNRNSKKFVSGWTGKNRGSSESTMGEGESKAAQAKRSHDAQEANNVSRRPKANRCRATPSLGKGQSGKKDSQSLVRFPYKLTACLRRSLVLTGEGRKLVSLPV